MTAELPLSFPTGGGPHEGRFLAWRRAAKMTWCASRALRATRKP